MVIDVMSTWTDYMSRMVDLIRKELTVLQLQSDKGIIKKAADKSSVIDVFAELARRSICLQEQ